MTLDEAIEVYEIQANAHERDAEHHRPLGYSHETIANVAKMQAREERQLAEWLKELKSYRETYPYGVEGYPPTADTPQTEEQRKVQEAEHRMANIIADMTPQTDCNNCAENGSYKCTKCDGEMYCKDAPHTKCDTCRHYKLACELFSEICKYEPITQIET